MAPGGCGSRDEMAVRVGGGEVEVEVEARPGLDLR